MGAGQDNHWPNILVTGGSGLLGRAIVKEFLDSHSPVKPALIRILDLVPGNDFEDSRVEYVQGDICDPSDVETACQGMDLVVHSASIVDWGTRSVEEVRGVNLEGTKQIIKACRHQQVR